MLLKEVAKRILECLRESDTAARLGGDEFIVLLPKIEAEKDAMVVAEKILVALNTPFELASHSLNISASIGVAVYPEHGIDEKTLVKNADSAMYRAKEKGGSSKVLFGEME
jgi:diguanylate cyclase (GGDEF)-like protein